jgi:hypothetical protein
MHTKLRSYKTLGRSVLRYGIDAWIKRDEDIAE